MEDTTAPSTGEETGTERPGSLSQSHGWEVAQLGFGPWLLCQSRCPRAQLLPREPFARPWGPTPTGAQSPEPEAGVNSDRAQGPDSSWLCGLGQVAQPLWASDVFLDGPAPIPRTRSAPKPCVPGCPGTGNTAQSGRLHRLSREGPQASPPGHGLLRSCRPLSMPQGA